MEHQTCDHDSQSCNGASSPRSVPDRPWRDVCSRGAGLEEPDSLPQGSQTEPTFNRRPRKPKAPARPDVEIIDATPNDEADPLAALENAGPESSDMQEGQEK